MFEGKADVGDADVLQPGQGIAFRCIGRSERGRQRHEGFADERRHERRTVREVVVRGGMTHPSAARDLAQSETVDARLGDHVPGGAEERRPEIAVMIRRFHEIRWRC